MITGVRIEFTFTRGPKYFAVAEPDSRHDTWPLAPAAGFGIAAGGLLIVVLSGEIRALIAGGLLALAGLALLVVRRLVIRTDKGVAPGFLTPRTWLLTDERLESSTELSTARYSWSSFRSVVVVDQAYLLVRPGPTVIDVPRSPLTEEQDAEFAAFLAGLGFAGAAK